MADYLFFIILCYRKCSRAFSKELKYFGQWIIICFITGSAFKADPSTTSSKITPKTLSLC